MPKKPALPIFGTANDDEGAGALKGTNKGDVIHALGGADQVYGKNGGDTIFGDEGNDVVYGGNGRDVLYGGTGDPLLDGQTDDDILEGGNGKDALYGMEGNDILSGGRGKDLLDGGRGDDNLYGGKAKDVFTFGDDFGNDTIWDFRDGKEKMDLSATGIKSTAEFLDVSDDASGNAVITTTEGVITVVGVSSSHIDKGDFLFA